MEKRGQFYLIAAVIIAIIVFSLVAITNYAKPKKESTLVFDLGDMLNLETGRVVDFAYYNKSDTSAIIENFTKLVVSSQEGDIGDWFIVYGDPNNITILTFTNGSSGTISVDTGSGEMSIDIKNIKTSKTYIQGSSVDINIGGVTYKFDITLDNTFAFIIRKEGYVAESGKINRMGG